MAKYSKEFKREISVKIAGARMLAGYRYARDFSKEIGIEEGTYQRWERGETMPSIEELLKICDLCGLTPNDILLPRNGRQLKLPKSDSDE